MYRKIYIVMIFIFLMMRTMNDSQAADLTGRVAVRSYVMSEFNNPYVTQYVVPSTWIKLNWSDLITSGLNFNFYFRGDRRMGEDEFTRTKLYDFRLTTPRLFNRLQIGAGRLNTPIAGSYGLLDGMNIRYFVNNSFTFGVFGGTVPDYRDFEISTDTERFGGYMSVDHKNYNGIVSFITQRYLKEIDRRYVVLQNDVNIHKFLTLFQSAELDIKNLEDGVIVDKPKLTYFYLNTRIIPFKLLSTDLSYTYRQDFKYLRSMSFLPDSLFNAVVSESYGIRMRIGSLLNWTVTGNYRYGFRNDNEQVEKYAYVSIANNNLMNQGIYLSGRYGKNDGYYADSEGWYFFVEKSLFRRLRLTATYMWTHYQNTMDHYEYSKTIAGLNLSYRLNRNINTYLRFDRVLGGQANQSRLLVEFSYRFLKDRKK